MDSLIKPVLIKNKYTVGFTEIKKKYKEVCKGKDWVLYSDLTKKDTKVFHEFLDSLKINKHLLFNTLIKYIPNIYERGRVRSKCRIETNDKRIEFFRPNSKSLPRLFIAKNNKQ